MKRSIGHLCHDEPKDSSRGRSDYDIAIASNGAASDTGTFSQNLISPTFDQPRSEPPSLATVSPDIDMNLTADDNESSIPLALQQASDISQENVEDPNQQCGFSASL